MKITILDGTPDSVHEALDRYLKNLVNALQTRHVVTRIALNALNIQFCTGCWSCWWKTPGECAIKDDSHEICRQVIHSDFVVLASPVIMGFPSALLKKTQDKLIPLLHPYLEIVQHEFHHRKRYDAYPRLGVIVGEENGTDETDLEIIHDIYKRFALNFRTELVFMKVCSQPIEEVTHAIDAL